MRFSVLAGLLGVALSLGLGTLGLGMSASDALLCVFAANVAAFVGVLATLRAQQSPSLHRYVVGGTLRSWIFLCAICLAVALGLAPAIRDLHRIAILLLPLILSSYLVGIPCVGWVQDRSVRLRQKRARAKQAV